MKWNIGFEWVVTAAAVLGVTLLLAHAAKEDAEKAGSPKVHSMQR